MFNYPARFEKDEDGGYVVTFRDIPEAMTQGNTLEEAREMAADALLTAMDFYLEDGRLVPQGSDVKKGEELVRLPVSAVAKVLLMNAMVEKRMRPADLAKSMQVRPQEVTRIMDLHHSTKIDTIADAFRALGARLELHVSAA